jgi:aldehyde dehydrogenase (NAD+)
LNKLKTFPISIKICGPVYELTNIMEIEKNQVTALPKLYNHLFIGGGWVEASTTAFIETRSPHDQSLIGQTVLAANADIDLAVLAARKALVDGPWSVMSPEERQAIIERFSAIHEGYTDEFAALITAENGSPAWFTKMLQSLMKRQNETYLNAAKKTEWEIRERTFTGERVIRREPVGVVAAIIPWNVPQQSALAKIIPALLAGCTVVFKPTPETALDGITHPEKLKTARPPEGVLNIVPANREVSEYLVSHPRIDKISFTGSTIAGKKIAAIAGVNMKRYSMELGGKSAGIILEDADISSTVEKIKFASFLNNGESCLALSRILATRKRYTEICSALAQMVSNISIGNPDNPANFVGPMVNKQQYEKVNSYLQLGLQEGAKILAGGLGKPEGKEFENGWYIKPTLFVKVNKQKRGAREEIFGPVLVVIPYDTEEEAIQIANDSDYGLCGAVWSGNTERALAVARKIQAGSLSINGALKDFASPFGGYKQSGVGRECGTYGLEEYTELKAIAI